MGIVLTGASGGLGRDFVRQFPDTRAVSVRYGDYKSYENLSKELERADTLVHSAALIDSSNINALTEANVLLVSDIINILNCINRKMKVIFISSMSQLDKLGMIRPTYTMSSYTFSKHIMEAYVQRRAHIFDTKIVRFSTLFYRDPSRDGLSKIIKTAKASGKASVAAVYRDFLPIDVACRYLRGLCDNESNSRVFNIGSGISTNLVKIGYHLENKFGTLVAYRKAERDNICSVFPDPSNYGLTPIPFNIFDEIDSYYETVGKE
jgi:nucleoside-diphosphate-sugar epimerase